MNFLLISLWKLIKAILLILLIWSPLLVPIAVAAILIGLIWHLIWNDQEQRLDERGTWDLIMEFERDRDLALRSDPRIAAQMLNAIAHHPARPADGHLCMIAERERARDVREVIDYLRKRTGRDLGDDPQKWINQYGV